MDKNVICISFYSLPNVVLSIEIAGDGSFFNVKNFTINQKDHINFMGLSAHSGKVRQNKSN